jgi:hypothetical protein
VLNPDISIAGAHVGTTGVLLQAVSSMRRTPSMGQRVAAAVAAYQAAH